MIILIRYKTDKKEEQLILIVATYQRGVYDSKTDFLQAETQGAAFIDGLP
jgi:hypothetical protein